ncbi:hypothetical protein GCM10025868_30160 [Angustibacter aerolatus]|uniref:ABC transporter domain-containing protein n=1 Tax=Angustibacter aerolatus TaxID=1162965 RepID=A0ABQ6JJM9_9ACTN|nr:hypothetical protein GCM10025868_30160 [Angustibacter aerolatus]
MVAVDGLSVAIEAGAAVGSIGANGAGKSTTIKMLTGILVPTSGSVRTCGLEPVAHRREVARQVGVVFGQRSRLWWDLPLDESFTILGALHRLGPRALRARHDEPGRPARAWRSSSAPRCGSCRSGSGCAARWRPRCCTRRAWWCSTSRRSASTC